MWKDEIRDRNLLLLAAVENNNMEEVETCLDQLLQKFEQETICQIINYQYEPVGVTLLHLATHQNNLQMVKLLVQSGADGDIRDRLGRGAIHYAALNGSSRAMKILIEYGADVNAVFTMPDIIHDFDRSSVGQRLPLPECWGRTPLHIVTKELHVECVKVLIDSGADVNVYDNIGHTPLSVLSESTKLNVCTSFIDKYDEVVELLVNNGAKVNTINIRTKENELFTSVKLNSLKSVMILLKAGVNVFQVNKKGESVLHTSANDENFTVLKELLKHNKRCNVADSQGRTSLHMAAINSSKKCLKLLVQNGGDLSCRCNDGNTVLDVIQTFLPEPTKFLTEIFDENITSKKVTNNFKECNVELDFGILSPNNTNQMAVIISIITSTHYDQLSKILLHPLVETYLRLKWSRLKIFYILWVFIHLCYVISLSTYILLTVNLDLTMKELLVSGIVLIITSLILFFNIIVQLCLSPKYFIKQLETWLIFCSSGLSLVISIYGQVNKEILMTDEIPEWFYHISSIVVLMSWIQLMLVLGRFPTVGYYGLMFFTVLLNIVKVLTIFSCLIIGFSISFHAQFNNTQFRTIFQSIVKTTVMLMGEYEYGDLFEHDVSRYPNRYLNVSRNKALFVTSRIIFLIFILLGSIVLMNLLIGLAVNDIRSIQDEGYLRRIIKQIDFIAFAEDIIKSKFVPRCFRRYYRTKSVPLKVKIRLSNKSSMIGMSYGLSYTLIQSLFQIGARNEMKRLKGGRSEQDEEPILTTKNEDLLINIHNEMNHIANKLKELKYVFKHDNPSSSISSIVNNNSGRLNQFKRIKIINSNL